MSTNSSAIAQARVPLHVPGASRLSRVRSSAIRDILQIAASTDIISLAGGLPAAESIPHERMADAFARALCEPRALHYSETEGDPELREWIEADERSICDTATAYRALVTSGAQQALDLVARAYVNPGDVVVIESPAYVGARQAFALAGARFVTVAQDDHGMIVDDLAELLADGLRPRLLYTTPTFHNPAGTVLSVDRRRQLAALADEFGFPIVEDDAYMRLYFASPPPRPTGHYSERVIRIGTVSKFLGPGIRVGWVAADRDTVSALALVKQAADLHTSTLSQRAVWHAVKDSAWMPDHLATICSLYAARAARMADAIRSEFGDSVRASRPHGGMFTWVRFTDGTSTPRLLDAALAAGVAFVPGPTFGDDPALANAMRLCFATADAEQLAEAIGRLGAAWRAG